MPGSCSTWPVCRLEIAIYGHTTPPGVVWALSMHHYLADVSVIPQFRWEVEWWRKEVPSPPEPACSPCSYNKTFTKDVRTHRSHWWGSIRRAPEPQAGGVAPTDCRNFHGKQSLGNALCSWKSISVKSSEAPAASVSLYKTTSGQESFRFLLKNKSILG